MAIPSAPTAITQIGISTFWAIPPPITASLIAANGPIAFATSFAPCAKLRRAAANIKGIVKRVFTSSLLLESLSAAFAMSGFTK